MKLRKVQSWTIIHEQAGHDRPARVVITASDGTVAELRPGESTVLDATLTLTPAETGWQVVP